MRTNNRGFSLIEVVLATLILGIVVAALLNVQFFMGTQSVDIKDKTFANQKAMQILEELRSRVAGAESSDVAMLDDFDDGSLYKSVLTTDTDTTDPASPISGNRAECKAWRYLRQIAVTKLPNEPYARKVHVTIYKAGCPDSSKPAATLAESMSILKTIKSEYVPTQVMDIYVLALENVPGWWSALPLMRPIFESLIQDLQDRNPGLELRTHWITRLSFGRDPYYTPYINDDTYTAGTAMPFIYFYPGLTKQSDGSDYYYYKADLIQGRINVDGIQSNTTSYTLADQFNHAVRYPEEERLYNELLASDPNTEPSLRMLFEKMHSEPNTYKNILLVNLHGELLPLPPLRNYSDPAKDPSSYANYRVSVHPEQLKYATSDSSIKLRVYPYMINPDSYSNTLSLGTMTVLFPDINIADGQISITRISGNASTAYASTALGSSSPYYSISHPSTTSTLITLYSTPMRHGKYTTNQGVVSKLYGLEYYPAPPFATNLTNTSSSNKKNTARWVISVNTAGLQTSAGTPVPRRYDYEVRIGSDTSTGSATNKPENISKSYFWLGMDPPETEKYQYMGDPRFNPYLDVYNAQGYNWYNRSVSGFTNTVAGWGADTLDIDVPRFYQLYRHALLKTQAIWSAMNGYSYYYFGMGGEFGSDMEPLPNSISFVARPWKPASSSVETVNEIVNYGATNVNKRIITKTDKSWYARYDIGELYPDSDFYVWKSSGNLHTGSGQFYRATHTDATSDFDRVRTNRTESEGCSSFFNGSPDGTSKKFNHVSATATGNITTLGTNLSVMLNQPLVSPINAPRPFYLTETGNAPPEWSTTEYTSRRTTLSIPSVTAATTVSRTFFDSSYGSSYKSSAVVKIASGTANAYVMVSGISTQSDFGTAQLGKYILMTMLRTFLDGGMYSGSSTIAQIPYVSISSPTLADTFSDPVNMQIAWDKAWQRWDGQAYTEEYPPAAPGWPDVEYNLKFSRDNGKTWEFCNAIGTTARTGVRDASLTLATQTYTWDVSSLSRGSYIIRLEAYRTGFPLHYSYDQVQVYINR